MTKAGGAKVGAAPFSPNTRFTFFQALQPRPPLTPHLSSPWLAPAVPLFDPRLPQGGPDKLPNLTDVPTAQCSSPSPLSPRGVACFPKRSCYPQEILEGCAPPWAISALQRPVPPVTPSSLCSSSSGKRPPGVQQLWAGRDRATAGAAGDSGLRSGGPRKPLTRKGLHPPPLSSPLSSLPLPLHSADGGVKPRGSP